MKKQKEADPSDLSHRITKLSRKVLSSFAPSLNSLLELSNYLKGQSDVLWANAESIDRFLKKRLKENPSWKKDHPKAADVAAEVRTLKAFVGKDAAKLEILERLFAIFSMQALLAFSPEELGKMLDVDAKTIRAGIDILLRGNPGRPVQTRNVEFAEEAVRLSEMGWTSGQVAKRLISSQYSENPDRASAKVRSAIKRFREKQLAKSKVN